MYREVGLMQVVEILRRWRAGESARTIAQAMGLARNTVGKYLREARRLGSRHRARHRRTSNSSPSGG